MKAAWLHRSSSKAVAATITSLVLFTFTAQAATQTQLVLSRDGGAPSGEYKGVVDLTVSPGFDNARVAIAIDGEKISSALRSPYRITVDFGQRPIQHKIAITVWTQEGRRVQWTTTVNQGHLPLSVTLKAVDLSAGIFEATTTAPDDDPVKSVELWDNGTVLASAEKPPYRFTVPAEKVATGFLQVTARAKSGEEAADFWSAGGNVQVANVEVRTVPLYVSVVDRNGTTRDDVDRSLFKVMDGDSEGKIIEFGRAFDQPISIALLLDASASMTYSMSDASRAAAEFARKTLREGDRCVVYGIQTVPRRAVELTGDRQKIEQAVMSLKPAGQTALYDGIATAIRDLRGEKTRRAIVVLTDGADNASMSTFEEIDQSAREAGIPIYFIAYSSGEETAQRDTDRMAFLSTQTGGFMTAATQSDLPAKYAQIEKDLRAQFAILYQIADFTKPHEWRKVRVVMNSPKLTARTIGGYFAP